MIFGTPTGARALSEATSSAREMERQSGRGWEMCRAALAELKRERGSTDKTLREAPRNADRGPEGPRRLVSGAIAPLDPRA